MALPSPATGVEEEGAVDAKEALLAVALPKVAAPAPAAPAEAASLVETPRDAHVALAGVPA